MTFERRFLLLVTGFLVMAVVFTIAVLTWSGRNELMERTRAEAERSAVRLARAAVLARDLPTVAEAAIGEQMVGQAALAAQFAALAEAAKISPKAASDRLKAVIDGSSIIDVTITDSRGKATLYTAPNGDVTFTADGKGAAFHGLLNRNPPVVTQPAARREDGRTIKTVAIAGVDKPRIVQVSADTRRLTEITNSLTLDRAIEDALVGDGAMAWVTAADGAILASGGAPGAQLSARELDAVKAALVEQRSQMALGGGAISAVTPLDGGGAAIVRLSQPSLPNLPARLWPAALAGLSIVGAGAAVTGEMLRRERAAQARLTAAATALEAGRFNPFTLDPIRDRPDEIGRLARAFRTMAGSIDAREQGFEAELLIRAAKLEKDGEKLEVKPPPNEALTVTLEQAAVDLKG